MDDVVERSQTKKRFVILLLALVLVLVTVPVWRLIMPTSTPRASGIVIVFLVMIISAGYAAQ